MFTSVDSTRKNDEILLNQKLTDKSGQGSLIPLENKSFIKNVFGDLFSFSSNFFKLQLAIFALTFVFSIFISLFAALIISLNFGLSLFIGSIAGIFYLRLLARSIGNLGKTTSGVSKVQLLIPVCLFIFASKMELLEILPAVIGFFSFKPVLLFYFSRS